MIGLPHYLAVAAILFTIGVLGIFLNRRNIILMLMAIELILLAVNINLVAFSAYLGDLVGLRSLPRHRLDAGAVSLVPEAFFDTNLVNGAPYPVLKVKLGGPRDADTIAGAVETVRTLVNEFSTLARLQAEAA